MWAARPVRGPLEERLQEVERGIDHNVLLPNKELLLSLAQDLPAIWSAPSTDVRLTQRIVRILIEEVVAEPDDAKREISAPWPPRRSGCPGFRLTRQSNPLLGASLSPLDSGWGRSLAPVSQPARVSCSSPLPAAPRFQDPLGWAKWTMSAFSSSWLLRLSIRPW
jgi:hypothetical protein